MSVRYSRKVNDAALAIVCRAEALDPIRVARVPLIVFLSSGGGPCGRLGLEFGVSGA